MSTESNQIDLKSLQSRINDIKKEGEEGSLDEFMQIMDLGNPDPSTHLDSSMSVDDLYNFFKNDDDSMRRD